MTEQLETIIGLLESLMKMSFAISIQTAVIIGAMAANSICGPLYKQGKP